MRNDLPISPNKKFKYSISVESWDEDSLEVGETNDRGFVIEDTVEEIGDILLEANTTYGIYMPFAFGRWESTQPDEDADFYEKGIRKFYTLHISNEDGTEITDEENDFITFLLSDGRYEINKFRDYAVGGIVLGAIALGVGALITYFYFKDKKGNESSFGNGYSNSRAKSVTHTINGKDRKFPIKDAWKKEHTLENKSQNFEVPQGDRQPVKYEMGGDASEYYHEVEYGEGGVARAKDVIINKIGWNEEVADYLVSRSEKFAIWLADSILKKEISNSAGMNKKSVLSFYNREQYINRYYNYEIRQILDWLQHPVTPKQDLRNLSFDEALEKAKEWHNELQVLGGDIDFVEPAENIIIKRYPKNSDGIEYYWVLIPSNFCSLESSRMGHCGRTGYGNNLISLRSIKPYGKGHTINDSHITIAYGSDGIFYQVKGKKNNKPSEKYFPLIFDLIKTMLVNSESESSIKVPILYGENVPLNFQGFGSEYQKEEDYGLGDMTNEQIRELYDLNPSIFEDAENTFIIFDKGIITEEEFKKIIEREPDTFSSFGNQMKLYERGIISEQPSTIIEINYGCDDVARLLDVGRDYSDDLVSKILCGDIGELYDSWNYYYDNPSDLVSNLNKENEQRVIAEIVRLTGLDESVVKENGIEYYINGDDDDFPKDDFDNIIRALASAQNSADNNDYSKYLYDALESALNELGEVDSLNDEGVKMTIDLSNNMSLEDIGEKMDYYEFTDVEDLFSEVIGNEIDLPRLRIDDRYSPYGSNSDFNDYFADSDLESGYEKGGSIRVNTNKKTKINNMKPSQRKLEKGGALGVSKEDYYLVVKNWVYFTFNYPMGFVKDAFNSEHLRGKFSSSYERFGSVGAVMNFWANLDGGNQEILALWIKNNYFNSSSEKTKLQSISDENYANIITHWNMFCFNFPYKFYENVFDSKHFVEKWSMAYERAGATGVVNKFFTELSGDNQRKLTDWVYDNYEGSKFADGGAVQNWEDSMKKRKDIEFLRIEKTESLPNNKLMVYYAYNPIGKNEYKGTQIETDVIKYADGGRVTTNDGIIESFLMSNKQLKVGNLSTHFSEYENQVLLRNYGTLIATRKGNDVKITNTKYSRTTSIITNKVRNMAINNRMNVSYVDTFKKGGSANEMWNGEYLTITADKNKMVIKLTDEGIEEVNEMREENKSDSQIMYELFEDIFLNSELIYHYDLGESGFGLTSASGVTDGYYLSDNGDEYEEAGDDARLYYFNDYMLRSEIDDLLNGELVLSGSANKYAKGGKVRKRKSKKVEPKVARTQFEEETYEYAEGGLVVKNNSDLEEVAKYMTNAVKKHRWDLKDLIYYFEKDNNFDYTHRVKIYEDMNGYEMPKTYNNIYEMLKRITEANGQKFAEGGGVDEKLSYEKFVETLRDNDKINYYTGQTTTGMQMFYLPNGHKSLGKKFTHKNKRKAYQEYLKSNKFADGGEIVVKPFYELKKGMTNEEQENVDIIYDCILTEDYSNMPKGYSLKPLKSYREIGMNHLIVEVNTPKGDKFNLKVNTYDLRNIKPNKFADGGGITKTKKSAIKLYYHQTSGGAEYLSSSKVKGTKDEGSMDSKYIVRIDGAKDFGGELVIEEKEVKLYYHQTSGGAEYLSSSKVKGTKNEGSMDSEYIVRIDGAKDFGGELVIEEEEEEYAEGGEAGIEYSEILDVLKSKIDDAIDEIPNSFENASSFTGEEVEHESRDGFIPYTDGGYEARWFEYLSGMFGSGYNLPTKPLTDEMNRQIDYNLKMAKDNFIDNYPEIVEELGEENIDYNSLYDAGYGEEAEELSNDEMEMMSEDTIMMRIMAHYYAPENYKGVDGKHTIRLFGDVNLESPYHRTGNLDDSYEVEFTFDSIDELETEMAIGIAKVIAWFEGGMYNDSDAEMKVRRMAKGGGVKGSFEVVFKNKTYSNLTEDKAYAKKDEIQKNYKLSDDDADSQVLIIDKNEEGNYYAKGGGVKGMKIPKDAKIRINYVDVSVYKDSYDNVKNYDMYHVKGSIVSPKELVNFLSKNIYTSEDASDYYILDNNIFTSQLADADGNTPSESEIDRWIKGDLELFSANFVISVSIISEIDFNDETLSSITGIGLYKKGGKVGRKKSKKPQPKMVRQYFEDEAYSYAKGGGVKKISLLSLAGIADWKGQGIKTWYTKIGYPTDDLGEEINDTNTFRDLWDALHQKQDVYEIIGVRDSVVRERLFEYLCELYNVDYSYVYDKWLESNDEYARGGFVSKAELVWKKLSSAEKMKFLSENFTPQITPKSQETLVGKAYNFLPKEVKMTLASKYANVEEYAKGGETDTEPYAKRLYSATSWVKITKFLNKKYSEEETDLILRSKLMRYPERQTYAGFVEFFEKHEEKFDEFLEEVEEEYAKGGETYVMTNDTYVNIFLSRGFTEKRSAYGLRFFEHKPTGIFITYDQTGMQTPVIISKNKSGEESIYEGNTIREVKQALDNAGVPIIKEGIDPTFAEGGSVGEFEVYDEETGKTLIILAHSNEEAEGISETIDFNDYEDGDLINVLDDIANYNAENNKEYAKGGKVRKKKSKKVEPKVARTQFEEETYEYAEGGELLTHQSFFIVDKNGVPLGYKEGYILAFNTDNLLRHQEDWEGETSDFDVVSEKLLLDNNYNFNDVNGTIYYDSTKGEKIVFGEELKEPYLSFYLKQINQNSFAEGGEVSEWMEEALESLIEETGNEDLDITMVSNSGNEFFAGNDMEEYRVFKTEDDAELSAEDEVREDMEESPENFNKDFIKPYIDGADFFEQAIREMNESYANDIESENDNIYANRLIAEMVENGLISDDDALSGNAEELAEYYKDDFVTLMTEETMGEGNDGLDYFISNFGEEETMKMVIDNNLIDIFKASRDAVKTDGVAHFLSHYDGETLYLSDGYVAYRIN